MRSLILLLVALYLYNALRLRPTSVSLGCGLWGAVGTNLQKWEVDAVIDLAAFNTPRGKDSTGICAIEKNNKQHHILKSLGNPVTFFEYKNVDELVDNTPFVALMGHNRLRTVGAINLHNAHPMQEEHIVGMHNGTIENFKPKHKDNDKLTDSRLFIKHIARHGLQSAVDKAGPTGAIATVYYDREKGTINFYRNSHRPLHCMLSSGGTVLYYSSEKATLEYLKARDTRVYGDVKYFDTEHHYSIGLFGTEITMEVEKIKYPGYAYKSAGPITPEHLKSTKEDIKKEEPRPTQVKEAKKSTTQRILDRVTTGLHTSTVGEDTSQKPTTLVLPGLPHSPPLGGKTSVPTTGTRAIQKGDWYCGYNNNMWGIAETVKRLQAETCMLCTKHPEIFEPVWWMGDTEYVCNGCVAQAREQTHDLHQGSIKRGH